MLPHVYKIYVNDFWKQKNKQFIKQNKKNQI